LIIAYNYNMLHTVIYTHRSGSTTSAKKIAEHSNAQYLGEVMHPYRREPNVEIHVNQLQEILSLAQYKDIVVKFHVIDLLKFYNFSVNILKDIFLKSDKIYYPIRIDYKAQIISQMIADKTQQWSENRAIDKKIILNDSDIPKYTENLINQISIQGQWYKTFSGELLILENQIYDPYPRYEYEFRGLKSFLQKKNDKISLFDNIDVLTIFENGNSKYNII